MLDILGGGAGGPGIDGPAQFQQACARRLGTRFGLGDFVFRVHSRGGSNGTGGRLWSVGIGHVRPAITMVGIGRLLIVHGE